MFPKIGFSTNVFDNPADVVGTVARIAKDFQNIELELGDAAEQTVYLADPEQYRLIVQEIKNIIRANAVTLTIHAPYVGVTGNLSSTDPVRRHQSIDRLKKCIQFASDVGAKIVTCHPGLRLRQPQEVLLALLNDSLTQVVPFAKQKNVELCVENMGADRPNYIVMSVDEQIQMCQETGVGITLDLIHLASVEGDQERLSKALERITPYVRNVHIADMVMPDHVHIPIGQGNLALEECLKSMWKLGYRGHAIVEEFGGDFEIDMFYRHARAFRSYTEGFSTPRSLEGVLV